MTPAKPSTKHHYIPAFYLRRWAGADDKVVEFTMPVQGKLVKKPVKPERTGYMERLYELKGYEPGLAQQVEEKFFSPVDDIAAKALDLLYRRGHYGKWTDVQRSGWSRLMLSLMMRCPEDIALFREWWHEDFGQTNAEQEAAYAETRTDDDPPTFAEFLKQRPLAEIERHQFEIFYSLVDNMNIGGEINNMQWRVLEAPPGAPSYLTSDRPLIRTSNINGVDGHIALPIGSRLLFIASPHVDFLDRVLEADQIALVKECNRQVVEHAARFVWAQDDSQERFIQNRLGRDREPRMMEGIVARQRAKAAQK